MTWIRRARAALPGAGALDLIWACAARLALEWGKQPRADERALRHAALLPELDWRAQGGVLLGDLYQEGLAAARRRRAGVHYTPEAITRLLVGRVFSGGEVLVDPACGCGAFLLAAVRLVGGDLDRLRHLRGFEIDETAATIAVEALSLESAGDTDTARRFWDERIVVGDGLARARAPVDAFVANPPFYSALGHARLQGLARRRFPEVYSGRNDISHFFVALALRLLRDGGRLGMVLPAYWLHNTFAAKLRDEVERNLGHREEIRLGTTRLFGAQVDAVLLCGTKGAGLGSTRRWITPARTTRGDVLADLDHLARGESPRRLRRAPPPPGRLLERLRALPRLASVCRIEKGCESGRNEVFTVPSDRAKTLGLEPAILRTVVKGRHVHPFHIDESGLQLIYLDGRAPLEGYPRVRAYLEPFRDVLSRRADCRDGRYPWWRLHRPRSVALASAAVKLVAPYRAPRPVFAVDRGRRLNDGGDVRFLVPKPGIDPDYLCAVLNSGVVRCWLRWRGKRKGELFELFQAPLSQIPIPEPTPKQIATIAALVRSGASAAELDEHVCQAYGVTLPPSK